MSELYALCGWRLHSDIRLPELPEWWGGGADDVTLTIGRVPETLGDTALKVGGLEVSADGARARMAVANVATYLIERGRQITVDPAPGMDADAPDIRLFLLGGALGYLCHQRGVLPLHASAVEIEGRAVLFTGISGAGKSTLAEAFLRRGHRMLSDDVAPVAFGVDEVRILPSIGRIRLWPDSAAQAGWALESLERCRTTLLKVARPIAAGRMSEALQPRAIFHLQPGRVASATPRLTPITGSRAVTALGTRIYRERGLVATAGRAAATARIVQAAARIPQHFRMERRVDYTSLPATIGAVIAVLR